METNETDIFILDPEKEIIKENENEQQQKPATTGAEGKNIITEAHRHPTKNCECDKCEQRREYQRNYANKKRNGGNGNEIPKNNENTSSGTGESDIDAELNNFENQSEQQNDNQFETDYNKPKIDISQYVSGAMLLMALDYLFPVVTKYIIGRFDKKYTKLNDTGKKALQLTEDEKKMLEPGADLIVEMIFEDIHPLAAFGLMLGTIYFGKISMLSEDCFDNPKPIEENA